MVCITHSVMRGSSCNFRSKNHIFVYIFPCVQHNMAVYMIIRSWKGSSWVDSGRSVGSLSVARPPQSLPPFLFYNRHSVKTHDFFCLKYLQLWRYVRKNFIVWTITQQQKSLLVRKGCKKLQWWFCYMQSSWGTLTGLVFYWNLRDRKLHQAHLHLSDTPKVDISSNILLISSLRYLFFLFPWHVVKIYNFKYE